MWAKMRMDPTDIADVTGAVGGLGTLANAGTNVNVRIKAPSKANPSVQARGENILPSTFWKNTPTSEAALVYSPMT